MTVTYTHEVTDCKGFGNFWRLLFRWRGSVYKLVWPDLLAYTIIYSALSVVYRVALTEEEKRLFEKVSLYCNFFSDLIPVSFILGFYVSIVIKRWWDQYLTLPWPDSLALFVSTSIHGHDEHGRLMRRTILRYVNLSLIMTLTIITPRVKKRFPTLDHMVEAGFMTSNEKKIFSAMVEKTPPLSLYYVPLVWAGTLVARARKEGRIRDDFAVKTIMDELNNLRVKFNGLIGYDWISIPLVYTQVVSLAVYSFFLSTIMGRQFLDPQQNYPKNNIDFYFPIFTMLQFFFYMGWLKVAESLVNPFGEDDDDFEVNWLIDRNIQVSYLIVDEMHNEHPDLTQDLYWDEVFPQELPYTVAAEQYKRDPPMGSTANLRVPEAEQEFVPTLEEIKEEGAETSRDAGKMDGTPGSKRIGSVHSLGSSVSGRKSSFMSMLHNRIRPSRQQSATGSQASMRKHRFRSGSQSGSHISDDSCASSIKRNNTNTSLQESEAGCKSQECDSPEVNQEEMPVFFLSSSPKAGRRKVTLAPLDTIISPLPPTSLPPNPTPSPKDVEPILIKVSRLQVDVNKGHERGAARRDSPCINENDSTCSTYTSVFGSQVFPTQEESQTGLRREDSHISTVPDPEEPDPRMCDAVRSPGAPEPDKSVPVDAVKEEKDQPTEEGAHDDITVKTWQV